MKPKMTRVKERQQTDRTGYPASFVPGFSTVRKLTVFCIVAILAMVPVTRSHADGAGMFIQYELSFQKKPKFRQFNISYGNNPGIGRIQHHEYGDFHDSGINVPIFSVGAHSPGLVNNIFDQERKLTPFALDSSSSADGDVGSTIASLVSTVVVLGLTAYAAKEASDDGCSDGEIALSFLSNSDLDWCRDREPL